MARLNPVPLKQKLTYVCSACGVTTSTHKAIAEGANVYVPVLPDGWMRAFGFIFCPAHKIVLRIDDQEFQIGRRK